MSDANVIACPSCNKRFRLPARPPATFACSNCGTVMDLSAFQATAPAIAPAVVSGGQSSSGGSPRSRSSRARASRSSRRSSSRAAVSSASRSSGARRSSRSSRGRRDDYDDYDDDRGYRRGRRRQKSNNGLVIGLVAGLVAVGLLIAFVASRSDDTTESTGGTDVADSSTPGTSTPSTSASGMNPTGTSVGVGTAATGTPSASGTTAVGGATPAGTTPDKPASTGDSSTPKADAPAPRRRRTRMNVRKYEMKVYPWHRDVPEDLRAQVEGWMDMYVNGGGRDKIEAQEKLIEAGTKNRAICGRIISEFKKLDESPGLNNPLGKSRAASIEQLLRKIDGWQERHWEEYQSFHRSSPGSRVLGLIKRWLAWWESDRWKSHPLKPWDEFTEGALREDDGSGGTKKKKEKPAPKKGFDKLDD